MTMTPDTSRSERIHRLAAFLREHGDLVLNGTRRLTLTTSCLNELNYIFRQFLGAQENESFDVPFGCSTDSDFVHDVFFLHDFMQKTCSLKIVQSSQTIQGSLDLSKFHCLKVLELKRVPPHLLVGFDSLVFQLETLICQRNISSLKEILRSRSKVPQPWVKITVSNFSYNGITTLDDSLALLPKLQYLDCSNNAISDASGVEFLQNVRVLNLSFNFLEKISIQNRGACDSLTVLYLRNNFIESTSGIERLRELRELDLSYNCLAESSSLTGLKQLYCLSILRLVGNPVTFHKEYFSIVVCHLHRRAVSEKFRLDEGPLPRKLIKPANARQPQVRQADMPLPNPVISVPSLQCEVEPDKNGSLAEDIPDQHGGLPVVCMSTPHAFEVRLTASIEQDCSSLSSVEVMDAAPSGKQRDGKKRKKRNSTRVAAILDQEGCVSSAKDSGAAAAIHNDFLSYKSQLESRKEQLGEEWLVGVSALKLPDAQSTPCGTPNTHASFEPDFLTKTRTGSFDANDAHSDSDSGRAESVKTVLSKEPVSAGTTEVVEEVKERTVEDEGPQRRISELSQGVDVLDEAPSGPLDESTALSPLEGFSWMTAKSEVTQEGTEIAEDMESKLFLVQKSSEGNETSIFVGVKDEVMRESDSLTGKIIQRLDLNMLSSASVHDGTAVRLKFDTTIRSKKERYYIFDNSEDAEEVVKMLQPFVEAKARKDLYSEMMQCVKCNVQFPKHAARKVVVSTTKDKVTTDVHESERCPQCNGDILLTLDTPEAVDALSCLASSAPERLSLSLPTRKASDSSSIGKGDQGYADNISEESIETVMPDQHSSLYRPGFRKSASDITILSNPSQSSIMVISTTSAHDSNADNSRDGDKTLSPPPTVVLPTLKEIVEEPVLNINRTESLSIDHRSKTSTSDTVLSDASFKSAESHPNTSLQLKDTSDSSHLECLSSLWESFDKREEMGPSSFTCPDHSILLHLDVNVFGKEEAFICCLEVDLVTWSSLEEVPALLVISSNKAYFFKVKDNNEREDPESWLMFWESRLLENLKVISLLLGNQGFCLSWQQEKGTLPWYMCLLRDADTCNCFLQFLTGVLQEKLAEPPSVVTDVSESLAQVVNQVVKPCSKEEEDPDDSGEQEVMLYILGFWSELSASPQKSVCIVITKDSTFIAKVFYLKTPKGSSKAGLVRYETLVCQKISNITALHICKDNRITRLTFLDEDTGTEMQWTVATKTVASMRSFLNTLRTPWEELFGVEMPLDLLAE